MFPRITDLWPNLLRNVQRSSRRVHEAIDPEERRLAYEDGSDEEEDLIAIDEEQLLADYKNLYWTRLMCIENYEQDQERKWPLGPDIVEECQAIANL